MLAATALIYSCLGRPGWAFVASLISNVLILYGVQGAADLSGHGLAIAVVFGIASTYVPYYLLIVAAMTTVASERSPSAAATIHLFLSTLPLALASAAMALL